MSILSNKSNQIISNRNYLIIIFCIFASLFSYGNTNKSPLQLHCLMCNFAQLDSLCNSLGVFIMKEKICGIYKITSPSKKVYIGQSIDINQRFRRYRTGGAKEQFRLENSIKKYGFDKHKFEILHQCSPSELNDMEVYYIELYQYFDSEYGLNLKAGGGQGGACSQETKDKIRQKAIGRKLSDETKKKIGLSGIGRVFSLESRIKKSKSLKGIKRSEQQISKRRKKVYRLDAKGNILKTYISLKDCASVENIPASSICTSIKNNAIIRGKKFTYTNVHFQK